MKIETVRIQNFRAFIDEVIPIDDYTCLVGPNGTGKSTLLTALKIFFRDSTSATTDLQTLGEEDFHQRNTNDPIIVTVTFSNLGPEAQKDFQHYYRQNRLVVSAFARWDVNTKSAVVKQFGQRLGVKAFSEFFKAEGDGAPVSELKEHYAKIRGSFAELPAPGTKAAMISALHDHETKHQDQCELMASEDEFYGVSKGANLLQKYVQWVCVPAVKDATTEQLEARKNALAVLLERTVRLKLSFENPLGELREATEEGYRRILEQNQVALADLSLSLSTRLQEWAHPGASLQLSWHNEPSNYVSISPPIAHVIAGEGKFQGNLARFGHGFQRSFLLALLQELSESGIAEAPRLILGCEEPELYQHPPQARHLSSVLQRLSTKNAQVIVSTHSPYFISGWGFQDVRVFRANPFKGQKVVRSLTFDQVAAAIAKARGGSAPKPVDIAIKVEQALQPELNEMFFASVIVFVEGLEDMAYITTYLTLLDKLEEFRKYGCHVVPTGSKSNLIRPLAIAKQMGMPAFVVFDADGHKPDKNGSKVKHEKDNRTILALCGVPTADPFPATIFRTEDLTVWPSEVGEVVKDEIGREKWMAYEQKVRNDLEISVGDLDKNYLFIGYVLTEAFRSGQRSQILEELCDAILRYAFAEKSNEGSAAAAAVGVAPSSTP
ncbi:MAG: AAA family ATPase [Acidobacteria bacterium]|nr:AAA family ATPase [Acidobacteriota bacterium]MCL5288516.1 AAA family ATPase [Acidobacteriota bacterium]